METIVLLREIRDFLILCKSKGCFCTESEKEKLLEKVNKILEREK